MWVHECLKSCPKMADSSERKDRESDDENADSLRNADEPGEGDTAGDAEDDEDAVPASFLPPKRLYPDHASLVGDQHRNTREYIRVFSKAALETKTGCTKTFDNLKNKCLYCKGAVHTGCSVNLRFSFERGQGTDSICHPCYENLGKPVEPLCANVHPMDVKRLLALYKDEKTQYVNVTKL